jgi:hypothetical protein
MSKDIIQILKVRFEKNMIRHKSLSWPTIESKLEKNPKKLNVLIQMEETGGEPDVIGFDKKTNEYIFCDCSSESPSGRRSLCYDLDALNSRKEHKPKNSALEMANSIGIEILDEEQYRLLQTFGDFDTKTSSWIKTPSKIRALGGALFCDKRYDTVFLYHNGAESYYANRGFRGLIRV